MDSFSQYASAYPFATLSSAAFYALLIALAFPQSRRLFAPILKHPTMPHQHYLQAFDTFRGFAAALVAMGHIWWATHPIFHPTQIAIPFLAYSTKAVPMFAVLSGFLIYRSALSIKTLADLRGYTVRRFFRIYPVYLLSVILCLFLGQYVAGPHYTARGYFVADLLMLNVFNWSAGFANPATWSLYAEVAFYVFLPLAVVSLGQRRMIALAAIGIIALIIADYPNRVFGLWKFFLMGILASEIAAKKLFEQRALAWVVFIAGVVLLVYDFGGPDHDWVAQLGINVHHDDNETIALGVACGFLLATLPHLPDVSRVLNILPLRLIGLISYSVYIVHFFYIYANFPELGIFSQLGSQASFDHFKALPQQPAWYMPLVFFPGVFTWALVCFLLVERPGMRLGRRLLKRKPAPIAMPNARPAE